MRCCFLRRRKKNKSAASTATPAIAPITAPAIVPGLVVLDAALLSAVGAAAAEDDVDPDCVEDGVPLEDLSSSIVSNKPT